MLVIILFCPFSACVTGVYSAYSNSFFLAGSLSTLSTYRILTNVKLRSSLIDVLILIFKVPISILFCSNLFRRYIKLQLASATVIKSIGLAALFVPPKFSGSSEEIVNPLTVDSV